MFNTLCNGLKLSLNLANGYPVRLKIVREQVALCLGRTLARVANYTTLDGFDYLGCRPAGAKNRLLTR